MTGVEGNVVYSYRGNPHVRSNEASISLDAAEKDGYVREKSGGLGDNATVTYILRKRYMIPERIEVVFNTLQIIKGNSDVYRLSSLRLLFNNFRYLVSF